MPEATTQDSTLTEEQQVLDRAYERREELLTQLTADLAVPPRDAIEESRATTLRHRFAELRYAESGLVFGRLDAADGSARHLGRVGLPARAADGPDAEPLVLDWRAPAARAFYTATPIDPQGQSLRRHIRTDGRRVIGVDDEPLDASADAGELVGEGALLAALDERRTGRMGTAVATLQREQDDIVRADAKGPLIVQGGPGTGKTVVALHRVAYLLFTHPDLARHGVLVLGPSRRFLSYISQVLPALGETAVVSATCNSLLPGVRVTRDESREAAEIKGRALWQPALEAWVNAQVPHPRELRIRLEGEEYRLSLALIERAIDWATAGRGYHAARAAFGERVQDLLTDAVIERQDALVASMETGFEDILAGVDRNLAGKDDRGVHSGATGSDIDGGLSEDDIDRLRVRLAEDREVAAVLDAYWPTLEPGALLLDLLHDADALRALATGLSPQERSVVAAEPPATASSDVALLDAVADLLGPVHATSEQGEFLADRAAARRDWAYGHVVVDEAQELSAMQWHMVLRRCPARSITAVGDIDQTEAPHQHTTWEAAISPVLGGRWRRADLSICYRTPLEVMALTEAVLARAGSHNAPPRAVRSSGIEPIDVAVPDAGLIEAVTANTAALQERWAGGSVGVVAPARRVAALRDAVDGVPVLSAIEAKGLEWDAAIVVDPDGITAEPRGWNGLYVALTRCTQQLVQVRVTREV